MSFLAVNDGGIGSIMSSLSVEKSLEFSDVCNGVNLLAVEIFEVKASLNVGWRSVFELWTTIVCLGGLRTSSEME